MIQEIIVPIKIIIEATSNDDSISIEKTTIKNLEIDFVKGYAAADLRQYPSTPEEAYASESNLI
jgi:hypothetical protein